VTQSLAFIKAVQTGSEICAPARSGWCSGFSRLGEIIIPGSVVISPRIIICALNRNSNVTSAMGFHRETCVHRFGSAERQMEGLERGLAQNAPRLCTAID
jgi:hypothetical protein